MPNKNQCFLFLYFLTLVEIIFIWKYFFFSFFEVERREKIVTKFMCAKFTYGIMSCEKSVICDYHIIMRQIMLRIAIQQYINNSTALYFFFFSFFTPLQCSLEFSIFIIPQSTYRRCETYLQQTIPNWFGTQEKKSYFQFIRDKINNRTKIFMRPYAIFRKFINGHSQSSGMDNRMKAADKLSDRNDD